jgi:EAL domain-containing protein (putative c-di-GMP-specific phosphodiesterase class I)/CheY-like chemotaxis protein
VDPIKVMLVDDEDTVLGALREAITTDESIEVVGTARDPREASDLAVASRPDVALVDVRMPGGGGPVAVRGIRRGSPQTKVVAVSVETDPDIVVSMLDAGAMGFVGKNEPLDELLRAVHRSMDGRSSIAIPSLAATTERLAEHVTRQDTRRAKEAADRIARAIVGPSLHMVFQPIVELTGGTIVSVEALSRFADKPRKMPEAWFAEAAKVGLLAELELAAIDRALGELHRIPSRVSLSINVSPQTMASEELASLLADVDARRLVLEMTEQSPVEDYTALAARLLPLRERGIRLAIDDVGAGYSSLERVVKLGPDYMKLDRSTVTGVAGDPVRRSLIERLVSFSDEVGISVIAEGVETQEDLEVLRTLYVPYGQGYHLGRPGPLPYGWEHDSEGWPGRHAFAWRRGHGANGTGR